ncbi:MAG: hypothetical protein ACREVI_00800 [Steroidobacteraceae bacterium]
MLLVAGEDKQRLLAEGLVEDFDVGRAGGVDEALEILARKDYDALLLHLDAGETSALELLGQLKRRAAVRMPAVVAVAREPDIRTVIAVVRAGAFDFLAEDSIKPRELSHLLRNAAFSAQSAARLGERRAPASQEVMVVGCGDGVEALVLLLQSSGHSVRHVPRMNQAGGTRPRPRAIVVDLAAVGDGEELLKLLASG